MFRCLEDWVAKPPPSNSPTLQNSSWIQTSLPKLQPPPSLSAKPSEFAEMHQPDRSVSIPDRLRGVWFMWQKPGRTQRTSTTSISWEMHKLCWWLDWVVIIIPNQQRPLPNHLEALFFIPSLWSFYFLFCPHVCSFCILQEIDAGVGEVIFLTLNCFTLWLKCKWGWDSWHQQCLCYCVSSFSPKKSEGQRRRRLDFYEFSRTL